MNRALLIVGIVGVIFSSGIILSNIGGQISKSLSLGKFADFGRDVNSVAKGDPGLPVRIRIPALGVDSAVVSVGLAPDGTMGVPKDPADAAWFDMGPRPGDNGSAVIAGHYGWIGEMPAAFDSLYKLQKGDKVYVQDEKGRTTAFTVREIRQYGEKDNASGVFGSIDGKPHLNLITCEGVWNNLEQSYSNRRIVFTDKD